MSTGAVSAIAPGDVDRQVADRSARRIRDYLARHPEDGAIGVHVEIGDDDALMVPRPVAIMLAQVLQLLASGQGVQIMPERAMLTTQQAADMINVSRPYLIGLLEQGKIHYEMVGTHRRIAFVDLLEYTRSDDQERRAVADDLTALGEELGED
jgi:excisionase family DNA binding protein